MNVSVGSGDSDSAGRGEPWRSCRGWYSRVDALTVSIFLLMSFLSLHFVGWVCHGSFTIFVAYVLGAKACQVRGWHKHVTCEDGLQGEGGGSIFPGSEWLAMWEPSSLG